MEKISKLDNNNHNSSVPSKFNILLIKKVTDKKFKISVKEYAKIEK